MESLEQSRVYKEVSLRIQAAVNTYLRFQGSSLDSCFSTHGTLPFFQQAPL